MKTAAGKLIAHVVTEFSTRFHRLITHLFYDIFHLFVTLLLFTRDSGALNKNETDLVMLA